MFKYIIRFVTGGLLMSCLSLSASSVEVKKTEEKTFRMNPGGYVIVEGDEGFIKVNSWDKSEVHLLMTKRAWGRSQRDAERELEKLEVEIDETDNRLKISLVKPKETREYSFWDLFDPDTWENFRRTRTVDFELTVPQQINLNLTNDEGDVTVNSIHGDVEIHVDEGDLEISDIEFNIMNLYLDEGDIDGSKLDHPDGRLSIKLDEGDTIIEDANLERLRVECDEGDIIFKNLTCEYCSISTDEGDIELGISPKENDHYQVTTDEGNITFNLPEDADVKLDLEAEDGSIRSDFDVKIYRQQDGRRCRDMLGQGNSSIEASTDEGTIYIRRQ